MSPTEIFTSGLTLGLALGIGAMLGLLFVLEVYYSTEKDDDF